MQLRELNISFNRFETLSKTLLFYVMEITALCDDLSLRSPYIHTLTYLLKSCDNAPADDVIRAAFRFRPSQ